MLEVAERGQIRTQRDFLEHATSSFPGTPQAHNTTNWREPSTPKYIREPEAYPALGKPASLPVTRKPVESIIQSGLVCEAGLSGQKSTNATFMRQPCSQGAHKIT
jgi:hypothetical protein